MSSQVTFSDDAETVVEAIQQSVTAKTIEANGKTYVTREVFLPPEKPEVAAIKVHSLEGIAEYLNRKVDSHDAAKLVIVIDSYRSVSVRRQIETAIDIRTKWIVADYEVAGFPFGRFMDHETFNIQAQTLILDTDDRARILKYIGNLTTALVQTSTDDGVSQTVTVETGVRKSEVEMPNPVKLKARWTFPEVEQPEGTYVLRVRQQKEGTIPEISLYEADGGLWKLEAIQGIKDYLKSALTVEIPIVG